MFTNRISSPVWAVSAAIGLLASLGLVGIALEKPVGSIRGRIALEEEGFNLHTYDIRGNGNKVYALAVGPRGGIPVERGVWVNPDGTFQINQLPVGEYNLKVRATGFSTSEQEGVFVDDARTTSLKTPVQLAILEPSVNIASSNRVFTSKEIPHFWVNATGSDRVAVRVYRKDILSLMASKSSEAGLEFSSDLNLYKPYSKSKTILFAKESPLQILTRKLTRDNEDWARADFKLNKTLPAGEYVLVAEVANLKGQKDWNLMWFSVSDLGLVVKQAPEKTVVRAINLNTLQPVPGVAVKLLSKGSPMGLPLDSRQTGADGFVSFPIPASYRGKNSFDWIAYGTQGVNHAFGGIGFWNGSTENYQTYFYTERPIYRLGQTVYFKGITRFITTDGYKTPKMGLPVKVTVEDPENNTVWQGKLSANDHGTFHGTYNIPVDAKTGAYQVTLGYPDGTSSYHRFEVAQYRKPEYQVDVLPLENRIVAGDKGKVRIRATYYFGAPVANARIKYSIYADTDWAGHYRLMPRPNYYGFFDDWDDETDSYEDASYAGAFIADGYAQTDAAGEAVVTFDTAPVQLPQDQPDGGTYQDKRYTVQAEVTDLSRIAVVGSGVQPVSAGNFTLFVQPSSYVSRAGEPVKASVQAVTYDGKPVANQPITVALVCWNWDQKKEGYQGKSVLGTVSATTNAQGNAIVTLPTTDRYFSDGYYVTAETKDQAGHTIYDQSSVWIASANYPYVRDGQSAQQEAFSVKLDKKVYKPGEVAHALITGPVTGKEQGQLIVAVEGKQLYDVRSVPMDATAKVVDIPVKNTYEPNVYVTATFVGPKHQFYNQSELLKVSPQAHFLNLAISTDKPKYKPGETATYILKASYPNGKPAPNVELSLGVVDESIYAIRPDSTKDIRKFFFSKIWNLVQTLSSFPEEYSGGPDKVEPRLRKDFRDVAAWQPTLKTNAAGIATTQVKLPDNLTTWRATVRGIDTATDVGSVISKVIATQDLIVRLAMPRFFTQQDEGNVTAIVHNYTDQTQPIILTLQTTPQLQTKQALVHRLTVKPDEAARYSWPVDAATPGTAIVQVKAVGETAGDAMETQLPVRPLGVEITQAASGLIRDNTGHVELPLKLPVNVSPELAHLIVSVSASSLGPVLGSYDALIDYPYGCTEQTMSRLVPSIVAMQLNKNLGVPLDAKQKSRFDAVALKALARLKEYHHADGGWGWWQYDNSEATMTAYVMEGLSMLKASGYPLQADQLPYQWREDGIAWLQKASKELAHQLQDPKLLADSWQQTERRLDLAYMTYVLSLYNQKPDASVQAFWKTRLASAPPEVLSYLTLAFHNTQQTADANQAYAALNHLADPTDGMLNWDHTAHLKALLKLKNADYTYRYTGIESTALALRAAVAMEKSPLSAMADDRLEAIERWLILQRGRDGWANTKTTAQVLRAIMEKAIVLGKPVSTDFLVASNLWAEPVHFTSANLYGPEQQVTESGNQLPSVPVFLDKNGAGRLYYTGLLTFWQPLKPGDSVRQTALPEGLKIQRTFYRIQAEPVGPEGTMRFKAHAISDNRVHAGETVLMKVQVESPLALPYVMLDAALPSGGEVVSNDPRESLLDASDSDTGANPSSNGDWGAWWWSHQDILDDRVVMFATSLPAGKSEFHALVRLELPGTFRMNPVRIESMYSQKVHAYSSLDSIQVTE